jgi:aldehyde:ferredoxin oxidoreductase
MLNAKLGVTLTPDAVGGIGVNTIKAELLFNRAAGFTNEDDRLPDFMVDEKLAPHNQVYDVPGEKLDETFGFLLATANGQGSEVG